MTQVALRRSLSALVALALALCALGLHAGAKPAHADPPCDQIPGLSCDSLSVSAYELMSGSTLTVSADMSYLDPAAHLVLFNANTGATIADCPALPCWGTTTGYASPQAGHVTTYYNGVVLNRSTGAAEEYLGAVGVRWDAFSVSLRVASFQLFGRTIYSLIATSNVPVPTPFYITIYREGPYGSYVALQSCTGGTTCGTAVWPSSPQNYYDAFIGPYPPSNPYPWNTYEAYSSSVAF